MYTHGSMAKASSSVMLVSAAWSHSLTTCFPLHLWNGSPLYQLPKLDWLIDSCMIQAGPTVLPYQLDLGQVNLDVGTSDDNSFWSGPFAPTPKSSEILRATVIASLPQSWLFKTLVSWDTSYSSDKFLLSSTGLLPIAINSHNLCPSFLFSLPTSLFLFVGSVFNKICLHNLVVLEPPE